MFQVRSMTLAGQAGVSARKALLCGRGVLLASGRDDANAAEPPALNPFAPVQQDRDDAIPGYLEMSDGQVIATGNIYMTRDKRLEDLRPEELRPPAGDPAPRGESNRSNVKWKKEWMEKEWRFKELAQR